MPGVLGHLFSDGLRRHLDDGKSHFTLSEHGHLDWPLALALCGQDLGAPCAQAKTQDPDWALAPPWAQALQSGPAAPALALHCDPAPLRLEPPATCVSEESPFPTPVWTPAAGQPPPVHRGQGSVPSAAARGPAVCSFLGGAPRSPLSPHPQARAPTPRCMRPPTQTPGLRDLLPRPPSHSLPCGVNFHLRLFEQDGVVHGALAPGPLHTLR